MPKGEGLAVILIGLGFFLLLSALGIMLICGRGGSLVNGYNFTAKGEKAKHYEKMLLRPIGICIIIIGFSMSGAMICFGYGIMVLGCIGVGLFVGIIAFMLIYLNTSKKMKRAEFLARKLTENPYYIINEENDEKNLQ